MNTESGLEVRSFMKCMFKTIPQCMAVSTNKVSLHLSFADHSISEKKQEIADDIQHLQVRVNLLKF